MNDKISETDTLAIDLESSWTNSSVGFTSISKGSTPTVNGGVLFEQAGSAYAFGGALNAVTTISYSESAWWKFTPNNASPSQGSWAQQRTTNTNFPANQPADGLATSGNGTFFYLGGDLNGVTKPDGAGPITNLVVYNATIGSWDSVPASGYSPYGTGVFGGAQFVPTFGPQGLVIMLGGMTPNGDSLDTNTPFRTFDDIRIYEPVNQTWYAQQATAPGGEILAPRDQFCTVGVPGDNGTYEMLVSLYGIPSDLADSESFIYGGRADRIVVNADGSGYETGTPSPEELQTELELDEVFVLSLPSFTW